MLMWSPCKAEPGLEPLCLGDGKTLTLGVILGVADLLFSALACSSAPPGSCLHQNKSDLDSLMLILVRMLMVMLLLMLILVLMVMLILIMVSMLMSKMMQTLLLMQ